MFERGDVATTRGDVIPERTHACRNEGGVVQARGDVVQSGTKGRGARRAGAGSAGWRLAGWRAGDVARGRDRVQGLGRAGANGGEAVR